MAVLWVIVGLLAALVLYLNIPSALYSYYRRLQASRQLPGYPMHWFWGNAKQIAASFHKWYETSLEFMQNRRYKVSKKWIGPFSMELEINHPELFQCIVKEPKDESIYRMLRPWLGDGLLLSSGKKWARNRRLLTPGFHYDILKSYMSVYCSCAKVLCDKWEKSAKKQKPVKLFNTVSMMSLDVILQCAFSYESNCQEEANQPYLNVVLKILEMTASRYLNPLYQFDWYYYLTPTGRTFKQCCDLVHNHSEKVIAERKKALGLDNGTKNRSAALSDAKRKHKHLDFLDILLSAEDEEGEGLTDLEIRDEVDTFMFEGHDTTTSGMCWTLYCLAKHPEHQEKVREEVRSVLMGREWLEYDDLKELKYTQWCIKEAMRLYPPVPDIYRILSEDKMMEGVLVPKGTHVCIKMFHYHRHPDIWENPNVYDPLRFSPANSEGRHPFAYIPFSAGNRNCIGQNFALNVERVVVSTVINHFKLRLDPEQKVEFKPIGVLKVKCDIEVLLEPLDTYS